MLGYVGLVRLVWLCWARSDSVAIGWGSIRVRFGSVRFDSVRFAPLRSGARTVSALLGPHRDGGRQDFSYAHVVNKAMTGTKPATLVAVEVGSGGGGNERRAW